MESFKKFLEAMATATGTGISEPPTYNDEGDDDDGFDCEDIRKKYWTNLIEWIKKAPVADQVRFNVFGSMLKKVKPQPRILIWGSQGGGYKELVRHRSGYAKAIIDWKLPMEGRLWDKLVEEQRPILSKSDLYKVFGTGDNSARLLFKGEVLECIVSIICALSGNMTINNEQFSKNFLNLISKQFDPKIEKWVRTKIPEKLRATLIMKNVRGQDLMMPNLSLHLMDSTGRMQAYNGDVVMEANRTYRIMF